MKVIYVMVPYHYVPMVIHRGLVVGVFDYGPTGHWFEFALCRSTLSAPASCDACDFFGHACDATWIGFGSIFITLRMRKNVTTILE